MSNAADKLAIANIALLSIGQSAIDVLDTTTPNSNKIAGIFENVVAELLADDWCFNRKMVRLSDLTQVYFLEVTTTPAPAAFLEGATLTGATSGKTCIVFEAITTTKYLVTKPSGDLTASETVGDGTNSGTLKIISSELSRGDYSLGYVLPSDWLFIRGVSAENCDDVKLPSTVEGDMIFTNHHRANLNYNRWLGENGSVDVSDVTKMRGWFHRLISARIAHILSPNVTENTRVQPKAEKEFNEAYLTAKEQNGEELYNRYEKGSDSWSEGANRKLETIGGGTYASYVNH